MKTLLFGGIAAIGLALGFAPQQASAHWETRTAYRWDAACGRYVASPESYWVPDYYAPSYGYNGRVYHRYHHEHERGHHADQHRR